MRMAALEKVRYSWCCISIKSLDDFEEVVLLHRSSSFGFCLTNLAAISLHSRSGLQRTCCKTAFSGCFHAAFYRLLVHFFNRISLKWWTDVNGSQPLSPFCTMWLFAAMSGRLLSLVVNGCKPLSTVCTVWQKQAHQILHVRNTSQNMWKFGKHQKQPKSVNFRMYWY